MYTDLSTMHADYAVEGGGYLSGPNEFQAMLGTAYDVLERKNSGTYIPWYLYLNDVMNVLPPQQMLPFEKVDGPEWYLREIGLSGSGHGYMWGVITQSIVGLDWLELALRGGLLGYVLARFHRWYIRRQSDFFATIFYMYLCLNIYNTFRNTTGSILAFVAWEIFPVYAILSLGPAISLCSRRTVQTKSIATSVGNSD
jgi:hypothetical protein